MSVPAITARILERIEGVEYDLISFTLMCDETTLAERARQRDQEADPHFMLLEGTRALVDTIKIDTANRTPEEVVDEMLSVIHGV